MTSETMPVGIVVERHRIDNPWEPYAWRVVAVVPGAPADAEWRHLDSGEGWDRYLVATLPLEIHRKDTDGYRYNLAARTPAVFVVLREDDEAEMGLAPFLVTLCPNEAQDYLDGDEDLVETVPMPEAVRAWLAAFIEAFHVEQPFHKRKRKRADADAELFARRPRAGERA